MISLNCPYIGGQGKFSSPPLPYNTEFDEQVTTRKCLEKPFIVLGKGRTLLPPSL